MAEGKHYLVIDTCVALAAYTSPDLSNPENCQAFLNRVLEHTSCYIVMAAKDTWPASVTDPSVVREIDGTWEEWRRYIDELNNSPEQLTGIPHPFLIWWISIIGRVEWPEEEGIAQSVSDDIANTKEEIVNYVLTVRGGTKLRAYGKDFHLIKGALLRDGVVVSVDKEARELFAAASSSAIRLRDIGWMQLGKQRKSKKHKTWMMDVADVEQWLTEMDEGASTRTGLKLGE